MTKEQDSRFVKGWTGHPVGSSGRQVAKRVGGSSIGHREVGDWTPWKVRPPPKRKKKLPTVTEPETLGTGRLTVGSNMT
jgi:hypothetical protein